MIEDADVTSTPIRLSSRHLIPGVVLVQVCGDIDTETAPTIEAYLTETTAAKPAHLVLDLEPVTFLSSAGLSLLLRVQKNAPALHLIGVRNNRVVERPLTLMGLIELFDVQGNVDDVINSLSGP